MTKITEYKIIVPLDLNDHRSGVYADSDDAMAAILDLVEDDAVASFIVWKAIVGEREVDGA